MTTQIKLKKKKTRKNRPKNRSKNSPKNRPKNSPIVQWSRSPIVQSMFYHLPRYKAHGFRIGAASRAAASGLSDAQIRFLGRWSSDAFKVYIRPDAL